YKKNENGNLNLYGQIYNPDTGYLIDAINLTDEIAGVEDLIMAKDEMKSSSEKTIRDFSRKLFLRVKSNPKKIERRENIEEYVLNSPIGKEFHFPIPKEDISKASEEVFKLFENQEVITATRGKSSVKEAPAAVYVVTAKMIKERGYRTLMEALHDIPGTSITHVYGTWPEVIHQRGLIGSTNQRSLIYVDGIPENSISEQASLGGSLEFPLYNVERIEIVSGPASSLYGANAFNGIINVITKDGKNSPGHEVQATYGSWRSNFKNPGASAVISSRGNMPLENNQFAQYSVSGYYYQTEGPTFGSQKHLDKKNVDPNDVLYSIESKACGGQCKPDSNSVGYWWSPKYNASWVETYNLTGKVSYKNLRFESINWQYLQGTGTFQNGTHRVDFHERGLETDNFDARNNAKRLGIGLGMTKPAGTTGASWNLKQNSATIGYLHEFSEKLKLDSEAIARTTDVLNSSVEETLKKPGTYAYYNFYDMTRTSRIRADYSYELRERLVFNANEKHSVTAGAEAFQFVVSKGYNNYDRYTINNYGAYFQYIYKPIEKVSLTLGGRHDENTNFGSTNNPRVSLVLNISKDLTLKFLGGTAFRAPSAWEMFSATSVRKENQNLRPEKLKSYEIGLGYRFLKNYYVSAHAYHNIVNDIILEIVTPEKTPQGTNWTQNQNSGNARITGSEIASNIQITRSMNLDMNYSYNKGEFYQIGSTTSSPHTKGRPGNDYILDFRNAVFKRTDIPQSGPIPNFPEHRANIRVTYYIRENISFSIGMNFIDIRRTVATNNVQTVPGYKFFRLNFNWDDFIVQGLFLNIHVNNATNQMFFDPGVRTASSPHPSMHPLESRNLWFTLGKKI
ncbi:MAG: TonB-dependent receptor, partial [Leptospiraceae bacterium]|nr:TonB-dependent receptor [Leptospiraceae bacterium]